MTQDEAMTIVYELETASRHMASQLGKLKKLAGEDPIAELIWKHHERKLGEVIIEVTKIVIAVEDKAQTL